MSRASRVSSKHSFRTKSGGNRSHVSPSSISCFKNPNLYNDYSDGITFIANDLSRFSVTYRVSPFWPKNSFRNFPDFYRPDCSLLECSQTPTGNYFVTLMSENSFIPKDVKSEGTENTRGRRTYIYSIILGSLNIPLKLKFAIKGKPSPQ